MEQQNRVILKNKISITGDLGSGKSVVGNLIQKKLGFKVISTGVIQREIAARYQMTTLELNQYSETHPEIDDEIDSVFKELNYESEGLIVDSRLAWFFLFSSFKVYMQTNFRTSAQRIMKDSNRKSESYHNLDEAVEFIKARKNSENSRFLQKYDANCNNFRNFDLLVDTSDASPEAVADLIIEKFEEWASAQNYCAQYFLSPKKIYPSNKIQTETKNLPLQVIRNNFSYYIFQGHQTVKQAILEQKPFITAELLAQDHEKLANDQNTNDFLKNHWNLEIAKNWEKECGFLFGNL